MEIEDSGDLIYHTYFYLNWDTVKQTPSKAKCLICGGPMMDVEQVRDKKGLVYRGLVCHNCKNVLWVKD